jgi:hypothetical protein
MYDLNLDDETIKKPGCWFKPNQLKNYNWKLSACQTSSGHCPKGMKLIVPDGSATTCAPTGSSTPPCTLPDFGVAQWEQWDDKKKKMNMNTRLSSSEEELGDGLVTVMNSTIDDKKCPYLYEFTTNIDGNGNKQKTSVPGAGCVPD